MPYPRGSVPEAFLTKLRECLRNPVAQTRGCHVCQFCLDSGKEWVEAIDVGGESSDYLDDGRLSSNEIRV